MMLPLLLALPLVALLQQLTPASSASSSKPKPSIIHIIADDYGWNECVAPTGPSHTAFPACCGTAAALRMLRCSPHAWTAVHVLSCAARCSVGYHNKDMHTPSIDKLAAEGVILENHCEH